MLPSPRLHLPRREGTWVPGGLALVLSALVGIGCGPQGSGEGATTGAAPPPAASPTAGSDSAGSDHAGSAGSDGAPVDAGLEGLARKPLSHEEFEEVMEANEKAMKALRIALDSKSREAVLDALAVLEENAGVAMASEPEKNHDQKASYLALFGGLKTAAGGLRGVVKMEAWGATEPGFQAIGRTCMRCHQQFRLSPEEEEALEEGGAAH